MPNERWERVKEIFDAAQQRKGDERAQCLDEACADEIDIRLEVESLLSSFDRVDNFMARPIVGETPAALSIEETFFSKGEYLRQYEIKEEIGAGGMGKVYLAWDTRLNRRVALKVLAAASTSNQEANTRLWREARAAATLDHPNICAIHEIAETDRCHFIVMQYVEGETLADKLKRERLRVPELLSIAVQVADALAEAHAHGIIHRDIKPANIIVSEKGQAKVLDFGLAKFAGDPREDREAKSTVSAVKLASETGAIVGTVPYMSPEQAHGKALDARTDIFSFGTMLSEMACGRQPFARETDVAAISAIIHDEPLSAEIPPELQPIVQRCLRKAAGERYQTAKDVSAALRELQKRLEIATELVAAAGKSGEIKRHKRALAVFTFLLFAAVGLGFWSLSDRAASTAPGEIDSIAVLPLVNATNDPDTEYLSDGITESIISNLSQLRRLKVMARSTVFSFKGQGVTPQAAGRELGVRAVMVGRLLQLGDQLIVRAELVNVSDGTQLWGAEYKRTLSDLLAVEQDISREISQKLRLHLSGDENRQFTERRTANAEAYQLYLRGRYLWEKRTDDGINKARELFQQAIDRDPNYALAYAALADSLVASDAPKARVAVDRAIQIDDTSAEAHTSSAMVYLQTWQWAEAEKEFERAISLNPNYATAHHWFANYLRSKGLFADAWREIKRAKELDPLSAPVAFNLAIISLLNNDVGSAIEESQRILELDPTWGWAHDTLGWAYLKQRRDEEAIAEFQKVVESLGGRSSVLAHLGYSYAVTGRRDDAMGIFKELEKRYLEHKSAGLYLAYISAGLGDTDQAFAWLEKDFQRHSVGLMDIAWWPPLESLRSDPRYADLARRVGLHK